MVILHSKYKRTLTSENLHQIRWFSIFNSIVTVLLLTGFLATILVRVLKNDFLRYARSDEVQILYLLFSVIVEVQNLYLLFSVKFYIVKRQQYFFISLWSFDFLRYAPFKGLGCRIQASGFDFLRCAVQCLRFRLQSLGFDFLRYAQVLGFRVQGLGFDFLRYARPDELHTLMYKAKILKSSIHSDFCAVNVLGH